MLHKPDLICKPIDLDELVDLGKPNTRNNEILILDEQNSEFHPSQQLFHTL